MHGATIKKKKDEFQLLCLLLHVIVPLLVWFCGSLHHALIFQARPIKVKNVLWWVVIL